jgi:hypothetical protein
VQRAQHVPAQLTIRSDEGGLGPGHARTQRRGIESAVSAPRAGRRERALFTSRGRATKLRSKIEHGLIERRRVAFGQQPIGEISCGTHAKWLVYESPRQYSSHVGVENRDVFAEGKGGDSV